MKQIVIEVRDDEYRASKTIGEIDGDSGYIRFPVERIVNGIILPEHHGALKDVSKLVYNCSYDKWGCDKICHCDDCNYHVARESDIKALPTIIPATKNCCDICKWNYSNFKEYVDEEAKLAHCRNCKQTSLRLAELPSVTPKQKWIPVSERLPEESLNCVLGWDDNRERCVFVQYVNGRFQFLGRDSSFKITAWMPLPEPYKEGESE